MRVPLRVLIVEDLPEQAEIVAHELSNAGFALEWSVASDVAGCRSAIEDGVDVVVADCNTVEVDLPAVMALLGGCSDPPPVVSVSTDDSEELAAECLRAGASAFLSKFRLDEIGDLARGLMEARDPRRAAAISSGGIDPRSFAENASDLIVEISSDGRLLYVNPSVEPAMGYAVDELTGRRAFEFLHPDDLPGALALLRKAIETGAASRGTHRVRHRDGTWRWLESTGSPCRTADGERRVIGISRDVTEHLQRVRALERDLQQSQQLEALRRLAGGFAHGFDNLLTVIAAEADLVMGQLDSASPLRRDLAQIMTSVDRGAALVRQLLGSGEERPGDPRISSKGAGSSQSEVAREEPARDTILLVEDEAPLRSVIRETLEIEGYAVVEAASGEEALERASHHSGPIHLMLSEVVMPGIGGRELTERIGASRPQTRVILMSGHPGDGAEPLPKGLRPQDCLPKPFTLASLRAKVREVLEEDPARFESR